MHNAHNRPTSHVCPRTAAGTVIYEIINKSAGSFWWSRGWQRSFADISKRTFSKGRIYLLLIPV